MKRLLLVAAAAALVLSIGVPARAATSVYVTRFANATYSDGNGSSFNVTAALSEDLAGNYPPSAYAYVTVSTPAGSDSGSGALAVTMDPTVTIGSIRGTIAGSTGPIAVNLTFLGLSFNSAQPPGAYAQINHSAPSAYAGYWYNKSGTVDGTVASAFGTITATGGFGYGSYGIVTTT